jgi:hypothetical protein
MEKIKKFVKKNFSILVWITVIASIPLMAVGCSLGGSDSKATPTPTTAQITNLQIMTNISRIDTGLGQVITRVTSLETSTAGIPTSNARLTALENQVGAMNVSSLIASLTIAQSQIAQLQADMIVANNRIVSLIALTNGSGGATPTPTPTGTTPTPTPASSGLVVTVNPLFAGAVKDATTYSYTFSVKNNFTSAKTFKLVADYSSNTMSANVNVSSTTIVSAEVISGFTKLFSPSTGNGCGLIRFTSSDLVIPAGGTLNINAEFTLVYSTGSPTTVWTCAITTQ